MAFDNGGQKRERDRSNYTNAAGHTEFLWLGYLCKLISEAINIELKQNSSELCLAASENKR
jgi:hypothetical protein